MKTLLSLLALGLLGCILLAYRGRGPLGQAPSPSKYLPKAGNGCGPYAPPKHWRSK